MPLPGSQVVPAHWLEIKVAKALYASKNMNILNMPDPNFGMCGVKGGGCCLRDKSFGLSWKKNLSGMLRKSSPGDS